MTCVERSFGHDAAAPSVAGLASGALAVAAATFLLELSRTLADEDLRQRPPPRLLGETDARLVVLGHVDLLVRNALLVEQALGADAVRTPGSRVDLYRLHAAFDASAPRRSQEARTSATARRRRPRKRPLPSSPGGWQGTRRGRRLRRRSRIGRTGSHAARIARWPRDPARGGAPTSRPGGGCFLARRRGRGCLAERARVPARGRG